MLELMIFEPLIKEAIPAPWSKSNFTIACFFFWQALCKAVFQSLSRWLTATLLKQKVIKGHYESRLYREARCLRPVEHALNHNCIYMHGSYKHNVYAYIPSSTVIQDFLNTFRGWELWEIE